MKKIEITGECRDQLKDLRRKLGYKKWTAAIQWLLDHQSLQEETVPDSQAPDPEKILQDIIGSESWSQVQALMSGHDFDLRAAMRYLVSCYRLISQEKSHQKLEGFRDLQEIHEHIKKMDAPGYSSEAGLMDIPKIYSEKAWLCCPICHTSFLLWIEDHEKATLERGIESKFVDGSWQRHFRGVDDQYQPVELRLGDDVIIEKSMAISTLKRLDQRLHGHILKALEDAYFLFGGMRV